MHREHSRGYRGVVSQLVCFSLLFQTTGVAAALPLTPTKTLLTASELTARPNTDLPSSDRPGLGAELLEDAWGSLSEGSEAVESWWRGATSRAWSSESEEPYQIAQLGGPWPLPPRLMATLLSVPAGAQSAPPSPGSLEDVQQAPVSKSELAFLAEKVGTEEIPLLPGYNLISLPEQPADTDPAVVLAALGGQLHRVEAYDACDLADPWKLYDPADPAASDLTVIDHRKGLWVAPTVATVLPSDGTLQATTSLDLCVGWNLIGFPAGEARHPLTVLSSIAGKWERIFGYDAFDPAGPWEGFDPAVPDWANNLPLMQPGRGYWLLVTEATTLTIRNQGPPPTVAISTPTDLAVVTEPTEIVGTVDSDRLASWTLGYRAIGEGDTVPLATGNAPVSGASFATFDPTLLLNGLYELELTATDVQGQQITESIAVAVEGQMKVGHFTLSFLDLAVPVAGLDIEIVRTYDSRDKRQGDFGVGWSLDIRQGSYRNNRIPGEGWQLQTGFLPCDTVVESKSHLTVVRLSDEEVYRFALSLFDGAITGGGCFATARFDYVDGPLPGTTLEIIGNDSVFWANGSNQVIDANTLDLYEPRQVLLTTRDGRIFELDLTAGVTRVEDQGGNQLQITPAGISHSSGRSIDFTHDAEGRIVTIEDPLGRPTTYNYDAAGDLVTVTDRAGNSVRFTYDTDHRLLDIEDPSGVQPIRNEYDAEGRLVRHIDAFGKVIELGHDRANNQEIVTNRLGQSRVLEYDSRGNVTRETDEAGNVTIRSFDGRDNLLSETDPLARTTTYTYNANDDLATLTDSLGNTSSFTYNSRGQQLTMTDPRGAVTTSVYDIRGKLTSTTDALGKVTSLIYDARGNLLSTTDALGNASSFEYDAFGNQTRDIDALGNETVSTYDAAGNRLTDTRTRTLPDTSTETLLTSFAYDSLDRVTTTTAADGSSSSLTYDLLGKVTSRTDALGRVTAMTYDLMGRLVRTDHPDSTSETQTYDAEGRLLTQADRAGHATTFTYDAAGRLVTTTFADGASTGSSYDDAGQLITSTDARGNTTALVYDAAGRHTTVIDPLGNGPTFAYDQNGNQTSVTDARGNTTTFTFDALNRLTTTTHPDTTTTVVGYDDLGRRVSEIDQEGVTTEFSYDDLGRLTSVTDALAHVTTYTYDEVGNRLTQTDANGHLTRYEYDQLGRQVARIFPDGSRESMTHNADGTLASHTDFNGATRTFSYDDNQRLVARAYPDGSSVTFTYTATGQKATVTDARGTTTYSYDSRDRLLEKIDPTGYKLGYTFDPQGNRTSLTATVGADVFTTTYGYDSLNRLASVTDSQGGVTTLGYDPNGNRDSLAQPNGVTTDYAYDGLNRLTNLSTATAIGDVLQSYAYTLGAAGNRMRIDEHDGTSRLYDYDDLYRLTQDRVTDPADELIYQRDFTYDPVGNRLQQTVDGGSGPIVVSSAYDDRDRLVTADATSYGWDDNGNLTSRTEGEGNTFSWDFESRLTSVALDDGTVVATTYDADGNRVRTVVTAPDTATTTVDFLIDTSGLLSHVVADVGYGAVQTLYTRANDQLINLFRPGTGSKYYHPDGLGSVRLLSDEVGAITDRYSFTAFGELVEREGTDMQPYLFAGEGLDPVMELYNLRARWLEIASGRFLSVDRFQGVDQIPATKNPYAYALQNPANLTDPSGLYVGVVAVGLVAVAVAFVIAGNIPTISPQIPIESIPATNISHRGRVFIIGWEAWVNHLYNDAAGHCTVGFGSLVHRGNCTLSPNTPSEAPYLNGITVGAGLVLLDQDIQRVSIAPMRNLVSVPLNQHELDAVASLLFNVGQRNFRRSQTRTLINQGRHRRNANPGALQGHWNGFVRAGGVVQQGLVTRRAQEWDIFSRSEYVFRPWNGPQFP